MKCPLCAADNSEPLFEGQAYPTWSDGEPSRLAVELCLHCGLAWQASACGEDSREEAGEKYRAFDKNKLFDFPRRSPENLRTRDMILSGLNGLINPNVLEIGANRGDMLALVKEALPEANAVGCDPARCELTPMPVVRAPFEPDLFSPCFDMVTMQHVLEHIPHAVPFLRGAADVLKPSGSLYVEVPNLEYALANKVDDFTIEHVCYYTPYSLARALDNAGMRVVQCCTHSFLRVVAEGERGKMPPKPDMAHLLKLGREYQEERARGIQFVLDRLSGGGRVVFYGVSFYFQSLFKELRGQCDVSGARFMDDEFREGREPHFGLARGQAGPGDLVVLCSPNPTVQDRMAAKLAGCGADVLKPWRMLTASAA